MRALVKAKPERGIWMQEIPVPEPGANDVLIRVRKSAICGTDIHIYEWDDWAAKTVPVPMAVGHEFCGEIVEVGALDPDEIHTPGIFVQRLIQAAPEKRIEQRTVRERA